ncbi:hypothetical protein PMG71_23285 [Roseofilum sp. BLCC_M154]|uniref:Uncharacterized protein n=1 Tax=Roseofilum acuticapitatum BLCC-M154 TaxID=3022444 RepID=A0ABT7B0K8_9CYAN|nr:hypothetical protein [Roseofilum acuticapitatum]MDJ1172357.1 hypothetical protein [Roseofilum acuticapitatum BLCC-M154]
MKTADLTPTQWQVAEAIADQLVRDDTDHNEFRKTLSYLRVYSDRADAGKKFFDYLKTLDRHGNTIARSGKTQQYFKSIAQTCQKHLKDYQDDIAVMLNILGWAARLMQYYKKTPIGEKAPISNDIPSDKQQVRQEKLEQFRDQITLEVGKQIKASVVEKKKGNKVKYEIAGIFYEEKEPKNFNDISDSGKVTVEIKSLKEDGTINHVKFVKT